jgi:hypothetical protein
MLPRMKKTEMIKVEVPIRREDHRSIKEKASSRGLSTSDYLIDLAIRDIISSGADLPAGLRIRRPYRVCEVPQGI